MKISIIETGFFKLDGGAMFGIVPRRLWQKLNPPDNNNMCTWSMRCLLLEKDDRIILIDTGIGTKQDDKFRSHFEPHGNDNLLNSLAKAGYTPDDVTDVLLTHLHFDHVGGAVTRSEDGELVPQFPRATYWTNERHYDWAMNPNPKEKASFLQENFVPLREQGKLKFIPVHKEGTDWIAGIHIKFAYGHTEAMMLPYIPYKGKTLVYCADLLTSSFHLGMPYVMSYDVRPLVTMQEKAQLLQEAFTKNHTLFFEHDPSTALGEVGRNERGRYILLNARTQL